MSPFGAFCGLTWIEDAWIEYEDDRWWEADAEEWWESGMAG